MPHRTASSSASPSRHSISLSQTFNPMDVVAIPYSPHAMHQSSSSLKAAAQLANPSRTSTLLLSPTSTIKRPARATVGLGLSIPDSQDQHPPHHLPNYSEVVDLGLTTVHDQLTEQETLAEDFERTSRADNDNDLAASSPPNSPSFMSSPAYNSNHQQHQQQKLEFPQEEMERLSEAWKWYQEIAPQGRLGPMWRDHPIDPMDLPWWLGYGTPSIDWDSLAICAQIEQQGGRGTRAFERGQPAPRRVLDIGSGPSALWCLHMLREPGWEQTQFVALDVAPAVLSASMLSLEHSSRISFIESNYLKTGLPFDDGRFNYVRLGGLALGMPEHTWNGLLEEVSRVLVPGGIVEVAELDFHLIFKPIGGKVSPSVEMEARQTLKDAIDAVFARRFINNATLSPIRPALAINFGNSTSSQFTYNFPSSPCSFPSTPVTPDSREEDDARIILHAYAQRLEGAAPVLAEDLASLRLASKTAQHDDPSLTSSPVPNSSLSTTTPSTSRSRIMPLGLPSSPPPPESPFLTDPRVKPKTRTQHEGEIRDVLSEWCEDLVERAGVARLVEERFGWVCGFDVEVERTLEDLIPALEVRLDELNLAEEVGQLWEGDALSELEMRRNQVTFLKREGEAELRAVRKRLGRGATSNSSSTACGLEESQPLGSLSMFNWISSAPSR
ncbi:hypothetical protein T439DRAFT_378485 [Meredithblackwellia eburnea MCA 4105]